MSRVLETDRLILRPPVAKDMDAGVAFYMSKRAQFVGGDPARYRSWIAMSAVIGHWQVRGYGLWAVTQRGSDDIQGLVGPFYPDGWPEHEIGWIMFGTAEGKGIAYEAAKAVIADARATLGWSDIVHYIATENHRSIALAERLGAVRDPAAPVPKPDAPCHVYRSKPGALT